MHYKVVRRWLGDYVSYGSVYPLKYHLGEWTKAPGRSGLLVFDSIEHAFAFHGYYSNTVRMCECKVRNPMTLPNDRLEDEPWGFDMVNGLWRRRKKILRETYLKTWPSGTKAYKFVKIIRVIPEVEIKDYCKQFIESCLKELNVSDSALSGILEEDVRTLTSPFIYIVDGKLHGRCTETNLPEYTLLKSNSMISLV